MESAWTAYNEGDMDALQALIGSTDPTLGWVLGPREMVESKMIASASFEVTEPCVASRSATADFIVTCLGVEQMDYWAPEGMERDVSLRLFVDEGLLVLRPGRSRCRPRPMLRAHKERTATGLASGARSSPLRSGSPNPSAEISNSSPTLVCTPSA